MFMMRGAMSIINSNFKVFLQQAIDIGVIPVFLYGYIYALGKLFAAISSKFQFKFNLKFNVRCVVIFSVSLILSFLFAGIAYLVFPLNIGTIVFIVMMSLVQMCVYQPCRIFVNNYMQVCIPPRDIEQAYSVRIMVEYLGYAIVSAIYSALLAGFGDNYGWTSVVYIAVLALPILASMIWFINMLIKKYTQKYTIIRPEYTDN